MLSQKLMVDVGVGMFAGENCYPLSAAKSPRTASFRLLAVTSGSGRRLGAFSSQQ
jgi:hypothetical protein